MIIETKNIQSVKQAALEYGVSKRTIYKWLDEGRLKELNLDGMKFVIKEKKK